MTVCSPLNSTLGAGTRVMRHRFAKSAKTGPAETLWYVRRVPRTAPPPAYVRILTSINDDFSICFGIHPGTFRGTKARCSDHSRGGKGRLALRRPRDLGLGRPDASHRKVPTEYPGHMRGVFVVLLAYLDTLP